MVESFLPHEQELLNKNFFWTERGDLNLVDQFEQVKDLIKLTKPEIIAIDPMANFFAGDEANNAEVNAFLKKVNALTDEKLLQLPKPPVIILVHTEPSLVTEVLPSCTSSEYFHFRPGTLKSPYIFPFICLGYPYKFMSLKA